MLCAGVTWLTGDTTLVPSVILLGSFLAPLTLLTWAFGRDRTQTELTPVRLLVAFALAGSIALSVSALIEVRLLTGHPLTYYLGVAVVEELVKTLLLVVAARGLKAFHARDGMVLGAAVGLGFAAFESAGYAFNVVLVADSSDVERILQTEAVRGLLAPFGHATWTALIGSALFVAAARNGGGFRVTGSVLGWFAVVVALHAIWDSAAALGTVLATHLTGAPLLAPDLLAGRLSDPTPTQARIFDVADFSVLLACSAAGAYLAVRVWAAGGHLIVQRPADLAGGSAGAHPVP